MKLICEKEIAAMSYELMQLLDQKLGNFDNASKGQNIHFCLKFSILIENMNMFGSG